MDALGALIPESELYAGVAIFFLLPAGWLLGMIGYIRQVSRRRRELLGSDDSSSFLRVHALLRQAVDAKRAEILESEASRRKGDA